MLTMHQGDRTHPTPDPPPGPDPASLSPDSRPADVRPATNHPADARAGQDRPGKGRPAEKRPAEKRPAEGQAAPARRDPADPPSATRAERLPSSAPDPAIPGPASPAADPGQELSPPSAGVVGLGQVPSPAPGVASVGQLPGLLPRRRPKDGGEVAGGDVDLVDALDPLTWRTVAAWLDGKPSPATRQVALQVLAAFLRWLRDTDPALELLAVTGAQLDDFCEAARVGALTRTPGRRLSGRTVARKRATLLSFYTFAWRCGVVRHNLVPGPRATTVRRTDSEHTVTRDERRLLRQGVTRLAADGRTAEAVAVALLESTGASADALAVLTRQDIHGVPDDGGSEPVVITLHQGRDALTAFRLPPAARPLLRHLCAIRPAGEPLIRRPDGRPVDFDWLRCALTDAALAGGIPEPRARLLHPHMLRPISITNPTP
ncbi:MAG TPA: hypothetical protein VFV66_33030 [Nonomuraea sp.]|nr:hypothetical protein [Nonomuraea sp.]